MSDYVIDANTDPSDIVMHVQGHLYLCPDGHESEPVMSDDLDVNTQCPDEQPCSCGKTAEVRIIGMQHHRLAPCDLCPRA